MQCKLSLLQVIYACYPRFTSKRTRIEIQSRELERETIELYKSAINIVPDSMQEVFLTGGTIR